MTNPRHVFTLEIDESLVDSVSEQPVGVIISLKNNIYLFASGGKIGLFSREVVDTFNGDFSKIPTLDIKGYADILPEMEDFPDVTTTMQ